MFNSVKISGKQICDYLWCISDITNEQKIQTATTEFEPIWTIDTSLLVTFNESLLAGNITSGDSAPTTWKVYRRAVGEDNLVLAATLENGATSFIDYNVSNKNEYIYSMFARTDTYITTPITTDAVATNWSCWCLFSVDDTDSDKQFTVHESFFFGLDVNSGQISNNVSSAKYTNFTKYPKVHKASSNYYSGTLSSLLGYVSCPENTLVTSIDLADRLKVFTTDTRRKFLKDIRGHIFEVEVTEPLTLQERDGYTPSVYDMTIGWSEIAEVSDVILIGEVT